MEKDKRPAATLIFIFGGSGDLNYRKLSPALYNLFLDNWMPEQFAIVGIGRTEYNDESYREHLLDGIKKFSRRKDELNSHWENFSKNVSYWQVDASDEAAYSRIADMAKKLEKEWGQHPNIVFYLAIAPQLVPPIAQKLGSLNICTDTKCTRIVIEKPFGHDLKSAHELN
ncbi:MAG TPA: glucose-6-phosphate dehydrogenase, partial [Chitinophagaceae bacterium]